MTPTQKPRIKRDYSLIMGRMMWFCRGSGCIGYCDTPKAAYNYWVARMRLSGKAPYPNFWS
jgi:hypothetical protein